ncbi:MAG: hypothetical protein D6800_14290, partial [Candidatus Zixiibacteriota bacterium]
MSPLPQSPRFRLVTPLGRGGLAQVDHVYDNRLHREAALKYALAETATDSTDFAELAAREYELIGGYRFPGIVRLLQRPEAGDGFVLMELCRGITLDRLKRPLEIPAALNLLSAIAVSLEFLRAVGLVHADIKPHNIFVPPELSVLAGNGLFFAKISDFAFGRFDTEPEAARLGAGTVGY